MKLLWETPRQYLEFTKRWIDFAVYWSDGTYWKDNLGEFPNDPKLIIRSNSGGSYLRRKWMDVWEVIGGICMDKPSKRVSVDEIQQSVILHGDKIEHGVQSTLSIVGNKSHVLLRLSEAADNEQTKIATFNILPHDSTDKFLWDINTGVILRATPEQINHILKLWEEIQKISN